MRTITRLMAVALLLLATACQDTMAPPPDVPLKVQPVATDPAADVDEDEDGPVLFPDCGNCGHQVSW